MNDTMGGAIIHATRKGRLNPGHEVGTQLEQESRSGYTCDYTYDDNGNRLSKAISGGITETYNYDPEERLTSVTWNGGSNYKNFSYDDGGRITSINNTGSTRTFTYDEESRLTAISGAYTASYEYNGLRTRVEKTESSVTRTFLRDGVGPTSPVLNDGAAAYTPGTSERRGGTTTYMHSGIKNADFQTNTSEVQTAERVYDAFGNLTASSGSFVGPFGYGGQFGYQEDGSGMQLLGNRYFDPSIGRFLTRDPIKDGANWYAYCGNNPVATHDPTGLETWGVNAGLGFIGIPFSGSVSVGLAIDTSTGHVGIKAEAGGGLGMGGAMGPSLGIEYDSEGSINGNEPGGRPTTDDELAIGISILVVSAEVKKKVSWDSTDAYVNDPVTGWGVSGGAGTKQGEGGGVYVERRRSWSWDLTDIMEKIPWGNGTSSGPEPYTDGLLAPPNTGGWDNQMDGNFNW